jgi:uncharacterized protein YndB with AHSA1/START domain
MTDLSLTVSRTIKASPERVFDAWLDPAMMTRFMVPRPDMHVSEVSTDPRVGGRFRVVMVGDKDYAHEGTYKEITRHTRLVFTWEAPWSAPDTTVTLTFTPEGRATRVDLTHVRFLSEESRDNHGQGWTGMLANLEAKLTQE